MSVPDGIELSGGRFYVTRLLAALSFVAGLYYMQWRWLYTLNMREWWIAIPLVIAETYTLIDGALFGLTLWRSGRRRAPAPLERTVTVDVLITTFNEPVELVMSTVRAAEAITYPHRTYVLDDGARDDLRELVTAMDVGYIVRSTDWVSRPLHAKAGNLNNALMVTSGEFLLILDADQVPEPGILDETLGYFADPKVALVQTPQYFWNVPANDPLGTQAPLFYGPVMRGKDGWNSAFFCGSNAVLRREALMQQALTGYVRDVATALQDELRRAHRVIASAQRENIHSPRLQSALDDVAAAAAQARRAIRSGNSLSEATYQFQQSVRRVSRELIDLDLQQIRQDLEEIGDPGGLAVSANLADRGEEILDRLDHLETSPIQALASLRELFDNLDVRRSREAQPLMPLATISVTEDMATAMRLHALGWKSVYHDTVLVQGMAPEDLASATQQRLRWAQGTLQVMLRENPLVQKGLSAAQRLMYFATMWNYLSGFANAVFIAAPAAYLLFDARPVHAYSVDFLLHLVPYLVFNQLMFAFASRGLSWWRGQQYSFTLFPLWIRAAWTTVANVYFGRPLGFVVTPKTHEKTTPLQMLRVVRMQVLTVALLVFASVVGLVKLYLGVAPSVEGIWLNIVWVTLDILWMSVVFRAAMYRGFEGSAP